MVQWDIILIESLNVWNPKFVWPFTENISSITPIFDDPHILKARTPQQQEFCAAENMASPTLAHIQPELSMVLNANKPDG